MGFVLVTLLIASPCEEPEGNLLLESEPVKHLLDYFGFHLHATRLQGRLHVLVCATVFSYSPADLIHVRAGHCIAFVKSLDYFLGFAEIISSKSPYGNSGRKITVNQCRGDG